MINPIFSKNNEFLKEYFEAYFKSQKRFPQSIIFEGMDILSQYFFTMELARILNCVNNGEIDCNCVNCKWIKNGAHPAVINVTPIDYKEDTAKTVISVKQTEKITSSINTTSDYHRFFIFSNAKNDGLNEIQKKKISDFEKQGYFLGENKLDWYPYPINRKILQDEASNALLKSVEEAPNKTTFVFLSNTKEDIIPTITSRSLIFKMGSEFEKNIINLEDYFVDYPNSDILSQIERGNILLDKIKVENLDIIEVFNSMQEYLTKLAMDNFESKNFILADIKKTELAKKQIMASMMPKYVLESLSISLSKEGRL